MPEHTEDTDQQKTLEEMTTEEIDDLNDEEIKRLATRPRTLSGKSYDEFGGPTVTWEREHAGVGSHVKINFSTRDQTFHSAEEVREAAEAIRDVPEWILGGDPGEVADSLLEAAEEAEKPPQTE